ncbi:MAG TPA: PD-(D/E)XK nuclease family protein [Acidimicrobiia bacterium]
MGRLHVCRHGEPARAALWEAIDAAKGDDALAPVTVVTPSLTAGLALRRGLARRPGRGGVVNVRFLPLARVAELLGGPALADARPLSAPVRAEAVRAALAGRPGAFARAATHPATVRSLDTTFRDLRRAARGEPAVLARGGEPGASVARLYEDFRRRTASFYDDEDLAVAAAAAVTAGSPALGELGHVVVHLPTRVSPGEWSLLEALAHHGSLTAVLGRTGDANVAAEVEAPLEERFAALLGPPVAAAADDGPESAPAPAASIVSAPDPEDEAREMIRIVMERVGAGVALHRMALLYRHADPYARLARELLDAAGIPWSGPATRRLADTVAGRVLLGLVHLPEAEFRRDHVAAVLAAGPVLDPGAGRPVPAARWDVLSRRAGVVAGLDQWHDRLARYAGAAEAELAAARADDEVAEATVRRLESDLEEAARLASFVAELGTRLAPPEPATWPALTTWARGLLRAYLGGEGRRRRWPEPEVEATRRVEHALDALAGLAEISPQTDLATFVRAVESELDTPVGRIGRFGQGIFAGPLRDAHGADFDVVLVLGLSEGAFPPRSRDDPVLPDRHGPDRHAPDYDGPDRDATATAERGSRRAVRRAEERRDYLAALAAAPERVLSFPRADPRAQRKRLPARWLVESAEASSGRVIGAEELAAMGSQPWLRVVASFEAGVCSAPTAGSPVEHDLRALRAWRGTGRALGDHPVVAADADLATGVVAIAARRSARFTAFDGVVGPLPSLRPAAERPLSPTALEDWAHCPFRYLLGRVLHLREVERPEETETISPLERGSLVHAVLEEFVDRVAPRTSPQQPWTSAERARLTEIAERRCDAAEAAGITGRPLRWRLERRRILRQLATVLDSDEEVRADQGVVPTPAGREVEFGRAGNRPVVVTLPDGRAVAFRGRIDRVDRAPDGSRTVVFDYKTGSPSRDEPREELRAGRRLQLPVYALAAAGDAAGGDEVRAFYWYLAEGGVDGLAGYPLDDEALDDFHTVLATILDGVEGGVFPAYPGDPRGDGRGRETFDNCCYCPFDRVCPPGRDDLWARKRDDPVVVGFRGLADPDLDTGDPAAGAEPAS